MGILSLPRNSSSLLLNASRNRNIEKLAIKKVVVNKAMQGRRRTYRAHGRINAYLASNCHVEIFLEEIYHKIWKYTILIQINK